MVNLKQSIRIDFYISGERVKYIYRESGRKLSIEQHKMTKKVSAVCHIYAKSGYIR